MLFRSKPGTRQIRSITHGKVSDLPSAWLSTRQKTSLACVLFLPCVSRKAHGKTPFCRVPDFVHMAKAQAHGNGAVFVVPANLNTYTHQTHSI